MQLVITFGYLVFMVMLALVFIVVVIVGTIILIDHFIQVYNDTKPRKKSKKRQKEVLFDDTVDAEENDLK